MNTAKTKRFGAVAAALVISAGLVIGSASAANAYPVVPPTVIVKVTSHPSSATAGKAFTIKITSVKGAKVTISYGKTKKAATKKLSSKTVGSSKKVTAKVKIPKKGTYYVKYVIKKAGSTTKTVYYKIKIK